MLLPQLAGLPGVPDPGLACLLFRACCSNACSLTSAEVAWLIIWRDVSTPQLPHDCFVLLDARPSAAASHAACPAADYRFPFPFPSFTPGRAAPSMAWGDSGKARSPPASPAGRRAGTLVAIAFIAAVVIGVI